MSWGGRRGAFEGLRAGAGARAEATPGPKARGLSAVLSGACIDGSSGCVFWIVPRLGQQDPATPLSQLVCPTSAHLLWQPQASRLALKGFLQATAVRRGPGANVWEGLLDIHGACLHTKVSETL